MSKNVVIGTFSQVNALRKLEPSLGIGEIADLMEGRSFRRWYGKNKKVINKLAVAAPLVAMGLFGFTPGGFLTLASCVPVVGGMVATASTGYSFWNGNGALLLHMLVVGFVTLVITTFLKFTGRGDLVPLVVFVGGAIILYEVLGLFKLIYTAVAGFFQM